MTKTIVQTSRQINIDVSNKIAEQFSLSFKEEVAYRAIRKYKNNDTHIAFPSMATIAKEIGVCVKTARSYVYSLETKGIIAITPRKAISKLTDKLVVNDTNLYTFTVEKEGKAKKIETKETIEVEETLQEKMRRETREAKEAMAKKYSLAVSGKAFKTMMSNINRGVTKYVKNAKNYMETIIASILAEEEKAKIQREIAAEVIGADVATEAKPKRNNPTAKAVKTKFHNFEQRSSRYSAEEINRMIAAKQKL